MTDVSRGKLFGWPPNDLGSLEHSLEWNLEMVEAWTPVVEAMEWAEWPALSMERIQCFCVGERDLMMIVVRNKKVCESFQTQTWYLNVYPCLHDQTKATIPQFYFSFMFCDNSSNYCNGYPRLNCTYLYNCSFKQYDQKTIRMPRLSTLLYPTYPKRHFHSIKRYISNSLKLLQNTLQWIP
jgi:hypothetical protein